MSDMAPEVQGQGTPEVPVTDTAPVDDNTPPWAEYLTPLPESVRPLVEPVFRDWDASVTKRFQSLHSEYEPYKPFFDEYEPSALQQALVIVQQMESDPQKFIQEVMEAYELQPEQGTTTNPQVQQEDIDDDPYNQRFAKLEEMLGVLAQTIVEERSTAQQQQEDAQLEQVLTDLKSKHGDFDDVYVLTLMAQGMDGEAAVGQFKSTIGSYAAKLNAPANNAPVVAGQSGGGYPTTPVNPGDLNSADTKALVVQMLEAQAAAQRG